MVVVRWGAAVALGVASAAAAGAEGSCAVGEYDVAGFDADVEACLVECQAAEGRGDCVAACIATARDVSEGCSACFGGFAECIAGDCDCAEGRTASDACASCSATTCEPSYNACAVNANVTELPPSADGTEDPTEETTEEEELILGLDEDTLFIVVMGVSGLLFLIILFMCSKLIVNVRRNKNGIEPLTISGPRKQASSWSIDNPTLRTSSKMLGGLTSSLSGRFKSSSADEKPNPRLSIKPDQRVISAARERFSAKPEPVEKVVRVTRFSFVARDDEELDCESGSALEMLMRVDDDWWLARDAITKQEGLVPNNILKPVVPLRKLARRPSV